jgi:DNA-binding winged helix-turn-helix (wHTH) protein/tetratricopeptide (TPR) repeat protein
MKQFASFRLDTVNQCLWRDREAATEERLLLTPKAFTVLRYLVEHSGRLVTQAELLDAVWPDVVVQPEVLKSQILDVRRALGDNPKNPQFIETLSRRGYRFIAPVSETTIREIQVSAQPRIVGRDRTLLELRACLHNVLGQQRQVIFVTGEPGIGKTALIDEFQRRAADAVPEMRIARGQCIEGYGGTEPFYPMLEALGQLLRESSREELVRILASQAPTWLVQFPALLTRQHRERLQREILGTTRERMLREIGEALETIASVSPLLILFEDLHWVDHATVDLISALARRRNPAQLMLVGTYRPADVPREGNPLKALTSDLLVHQLCHAIALLPLEEADVDAYLRSASSETDGLATLIHRHSEGNPLFIVAALEHMTRRGLLAQENGAWRLRVPLQEIDLGIPETLRQMIQARIERASVEEQRALELASVMGAVFSAEVIAPVTNTDPEHLEHLFEELAHRHHIVRRTERHLFPAASDAQWYEFSHALYREIVYQRTARGRRTRTHRSIGDWLEARFADHPGDVAHHLAHHFEQGSDWTRAVKYLRIAADAAARRYAPLDAVPMLERALKLASNLPEPERSASEIETLDELATSYLASGDYRAVEAYKTLIDRAAQRGLGDMELRLLLGLAWAEAWFSPERALDVLDLALRRCAERRDSLLQPRTRASCLAWRVWIRGWNSADAQECRVAIAQAREVGDDAVLAPHLIDYSVIPLFSSDYREAYRSLLDGRQILRDAFGKNPYTNIPYELAQFLLPLCLTYMGEWGEALREIDVTITMLDRNGDYYRAQALRLLRAGIHLQAMDFKGARAICESAVPLIRDPTPRPAPDVLTPGTGEFRWALILAGRAEVALGNNERALENLCAASLDMDRSPSMFDWYWRMPLAAGFAEVALAAGDLPRARAEAQRFLDLTLTTEERTWQALAWEASARVARAERNLDRAQDCVQKALLTMEGIEVPLAAWRVHATAADIFAVSGNTEASERHRQRSRETILKLANSLAKDHPLRTNFLAAPAVSRIMIGADA